MNIQKEQGDALTATHYQVEGQQYIETMQRNLSPEEFQGLLRGNALKYLLRMGRKGDPLKDARKALQYNEWLVQSIEGKIIDPRAQATSASEAVIVIVQPARRCKKTVIRELSKKNEQLEMVIDAALTSATEFGCPDGGECSSCKGTCAKCWRMFWESKVVDREG